VTNLDFVEYLLKEGADPNARDGLGKTPLMEIIPYAPGATKFLLNWPTIDANIPDQSGVSFLAMVSGLVGMDSDNVAHPERPVLVQHEFLVQQWREIEEMLLESGALDTGITTIE
jgi:ankyrin repeat protein